MGLVKEEWSRGLRRGLCAGKGEEGMQMDPPLKKGKTVGERYTDEGKQCMRSLMGRIKGSTRWASGEIQQTWTTLQELHSL